ncbi:MAG: DNA methyltransferase [Dehalococcoidia bacterium]
MLELNQIYNMDCMEGMKQIPDKYFELAIVDPPYGIGFDGEKPTMVKGHAKGYITKTWDSAPPSKEYFEEIIRVSKNQIIWGANHFISKIPYDSSCWIFWDKQKGNFSLADGELAWTSFKTAVRQFTYQWHGFIQQNMGADKEERIHPTQKPVALYQWLLRNYAKPGDKILDTHMGSGSSIIACHDMGFEYMAFEIDEDYYKAAMKRINEHKAQVRFDL